MLGFAVLLVINAAVLWDGAFPFLPKRMQTWEVMSIFYLLQSVAFWGTFLAGMFAAYFFPRFTNRTLVLPCVLPVFIGSFCLVATLYLPSLSIPFIYVGAVLLGVGCAGLFILWQRFFSSLPPERGNRYLIVGTGLSALIYFGLHALPIMVTSFFIPIVLVPLCGVMLILSTRDIDFAQPMFEDIPQKNERVYLNTVRGYWASALCVGCLGLSSGIIRALALIDPLLGMHLNFTATAGVFVSALFLLALWRRSPFRFDVIRSFRIVFPFIVTGFLLLPFLGQSFLHGFSGILYAIFTLSVMVMMIQCSQASRDIGINPPFIYGFFAAIVYALQSLGFVLGIMSDGYETWESGHFLIVALGAVWVLALVLFAVRGSVTDVYSLLRSSPSQVEFLPAGEDVVEVFPQTDDPDLSEVSDASDASDNFDASDSFDASNSFDVPDSSDIPDSSDTSEAPVASALSAASVPRAVPASRAASATAGSPVSSGFPSSPGLPSSSGLPSPPGLSSSPGLPEASGLSKTPAVSGVDRSAFSSLPGPPAPLYHDRASNCCALLQQFYPLSTRECEVVELIARGNSVASIAERLVVSENTVRTHMKRIYSKLAIHKRQELLDLLEELE
jgi:DNA-binding CsgD family transcriptional regulator/MFS family permease